MLTWFSEQWGIEKVGSRRGAQLCLRARDGETGAAAADAMVALIILALVSVLALGALAQSGRVASAALEVRRAQILLAWLIESGPRSLTPTAGVTDGFDWRLETQLTGADQPIAVCRRAVSLVARQTRRAYSAATLQTCPSATS